MAQWTNIPTDRIEPGKPIRAIDGLALRDNPIAIAEGASGAPKISEQAFSTNSINGNRLRTNSVSNDRLVNKTITNAKIANNTITGALFNDGSVRSWIGSQSAGAVGTYAFAIVWTGGGSYGWNDTVPGSNLRRSNANNAGGTSNTNLSGGTWRVLSNSITPNVAGLVVRIS